MPDVRPLNKKYDISKHRFYELYHYCMQYNEWVDELKYNTDSLGATGDGQPRGSNISNSTARIGERRAELSKKCELIEQTAIESDAEIYQHILKAVTNDRVTYNYLRNIMHIPCGHNVYYDRRKRFYWLLDKKI